MFMPHRHLQSNDKFAFSRALRRWSMAIATRAFAPHSSERARVRKELRRQRERRAGGNAAAPSR